MTVTPPVDPDRMPSPEWDMVTLKWLGRMFTGTTLPGDLSIKIDRTKPMLYDDPDSPVTIFPHAIRVPIEIIQLTDDDGVVRDYMYVAVNLPASDDPDIVGTGFSYTATIVLTGGPTYGPFTFALPHATVGGVVWLNRVMAVLPTPGEALPQITRAEFDAAVGRIELIEAGGVGGVGTQGPKGDPGPPGPAGADGADAVLSLIDFAATYTNERDSYGGTTGQEVANPLGTTVMTATGPPADPGVGAVIRSPNPSPCTVPSVLTGPRLTFAAGDNPETLNGMTLAPGTVVQFQRGATWPNVRLQINTTATQEQPVLLCSYGDWNAPAPTFQAIKPGAFKDDGIIAVKGPNVHIRDLRFADSVSIAVNVYPEAPNTIITNCEVSACVIGFWIRGEWSKLWNSWIYDGVMMADTPGPLDDYGACGVVIEGSNIVVDGITGHRLSAYSPDYEQWGPDGSLSEVWMEGDNLKLRYSYLEGSPRILETGGLESAHSAVNMELHGIFARDVTDGPFYDNPEGPYGGMDVTGKRVYDTIVDGVAWNVP